MKFLHTGDLHIGKRVNEISMLDEQKYVLEQILDIAVTRKIDNVLISGDVYDKTIPPCEAVEAFDEFLTQLSYEKIGAYIISGNHDSQERLGFARRLLKLGNINIAGEYKGEIEKHEVKDEYGYIYIYLLPFIKAPSVKKYFPEKEINSTHEAIKAIIEKENIDVSQRNILISHQFVTAVGVTPEQSESEINPIGGVDNIDVGLFSKFDYVALGHLHGQQQVGRETVRYSGSPLKYSFSEVRQNKCVTIVEMLKKGEILLEKIPLIPKRDMRVIKGPLEGLLSVAKEQGASEDYILAILTDEEILIDPIAKLRQYYPNIMKLEFENTRTSSEVSTTSAKDVENQTPLQLFEEFYSVQNNTELCEEKLSIVKRVFEEELGL